MEKQIAAIPQKSAHRSEKVVSVQVSVQVERFLWNSGKSKNPSKYVRNAVILTEVTWNNYELSSRISELLKQSTRKIKRKNKFPLTSLIGHVEIEDNEFRRSPVIYLPYKGLVPWK